MLRKCLHRSHVQSPHTHTLTHSYSFARMASSWALTSIQVRVAQDLHGEEALLASGTEQRAKVRVEDRVPFLPRLLDLSPQIRQPLLRRQPSSPHRHTITSHAHRQRHKSMSAKRTGRSLPVLFASISRKNCVSLQKYSESKGRKGNIRPGDHRECAYLCAHPLEVEEAVVELHVLPPDVYLPLYFWNDEQRPPAVRLKIYYKSPRTWDIFVSANTRQAIGFTLCD
jgi:hypothetical protein